MFLNIEISFHNKSSISPNWDDDLAIKSKTGLQLTKTKYNYNNHFPHKPKLRKIFKSFSSKIFYICMKNMKQFK